jgi:glyceraldehyde 3-phosphate dehydrogenase (phosphorylating)
MAPDPDLGSRFSASSRAHLTTIIHVAQVKVVAWYDNEWGYPSRLVELAKRVAVPVAGAS